MAFLMTSTRPESRNSSILSRTCSSISSASSSLSRSFRLSTYTATQVTVIMIDIQGFTAECAAMPAASVGEWVAAFYSRVDKVAAAHGVRKVEVRGDCCVCVAGLEGSIPALASSHTAAADLRSDQATRVLAFAAALHANLASLTAGAAGAAASTATRMGVATGDAAFLLSDAAAGADAAPFASVRGDAVDLAAQLEALAAPGAVHVHRSTADKWAAETRRPPPPTEVVECGRGPQRAAVYDCVARRFLPAAAPPPAARRRSEPTAGGEARALRQRASACF
jgi:class 3 adenylate cyclase